MPLLCTSRYVTACDTFTRSLPALVLQGTNAGERRPGYEGRDYLDSQARHSQSVQGEKEHLVTLDRFCGQCWQYQSEIAELLIIAFTFHIGHIIFSNKKNGFASYMSLTVASERHKQHTNCFLLITNVIEQLSSPPDMGIAMTFQVEKCSNRQE